MLIASSLVTAKATNSNPLSDVRVRHAIAHAIDMETIKDTLLEGKALVADAHIPNGPYKPAGLENYAYDPDKARRLLKEANWDSSIELDMVFYYGDQLTVDLMTAIQAYLADVGVKMSFRKLEGDVGAQLWTAPKDGFNGPAEVKWDLAYGAHGPLALQEYYVRYKSGDNSYTPSDTKLDRMISAITTTPDVDKQKAGFFNIVKYMQDQLYTYPLYYQQAFIYESKNVNRNGGMYGNPQYNYIKKYIKNKYDSNFDLHIHDRLFNRFTHDNFFLERHGILGKFCQFLYKIKLNRLIFNFLKIPFPYMKLEIKNFLK